MRRGWTRGAAPRGRGLCGVLLVLVLAVLVPTACVLWFMTAAMRNERLAVRQKLADVYRRRLEVASEALEAYWSRKAAALGEFAELPPQEAFAAIVTSGAAESAVILDESGRVVYPSAASAAPSEDESDRWRHARELEYESLEPEKAAAVYSEIAQAAAEPSEKALALRGQARSLVKAGREEEALSVLTGIFTDEGLRDAADAQGRVIAPGAMLLALRLHGEGESAAAGELAVQLAGRLDDYAPPAMLSSQRRFLMHALAELAPEGAQLEMLPAEELACDYLNFTPRAAEGLRLTKAGGDGLWQFASRGGTVVALFREEALFGELRAAAGLDGAIDGAVVSLVGPPSTAGKPAAAEEREAFLSSAAGESMPGWALDVHLVGGDPFTAAATRQVAVYFWTALLGIVAIALFAVVAARYVTRQMRLTRLKNDLIATVTHELKTPLASMRVLVDTLLEGRCESAEDVREYYGLIAAENERLSRLIDNFLTFSRMERGKHAFDFAAVRPDEVAAAAAGSIAENCRRGGWRLSVDVAEGLPAVRADRGALITVLLNLIENAYKYTGERKEIALGAYTEEGWVSFEVSDNGIGISRRDRRRIFERFYQVDRSLSTSGGGCGLGLAIVKFIVDAHGGSVEVADRPEGGSIFTVGLPRFDRPARGAQ